MRIVMVKLSKKCFAESRDIIDVLREKYPDAAHWLRNEDQISYSLASLGWTIQKLERTHVQVSVYLVPCMVIEVDDWVPK